MVEKDKKSKGTSGITMIALVITIILLLILAGISVATLTGENGILTKAQEAKIATEKAAIEEQLRLAQLSAKTQAMGGPINIQDILDELDKAGVDYEVTEGEDGGTTIIIDGEYIYDILEKDGDVDFEPQGTVDKLLPRIDILETNREGSTIKVKVATKRNEEGTLEFYIREENEIHYTKKEIVEDAPSEYEYTFKEIDASKVYQIKIVAIAKNGERKEKEVTVVEIPTLNSSNTIFSYTPTNYTKGNVMVSISNKNINMTGYTLQYAIDNPEVESNWKNYTTGITMKQNGDVYVRLKDNNKEQVGKYTRIGKIQNIDQTAPVISILEVTKVMTNRITIEGSATDEGIGIGKYYFSISKDNGTTWETEEVTATEGQETVSHTFEGLTQETEYKLQLIVEDKLGNKSEAKSVTQKPEDMPVLQEGDITCSYEPELNENGWTNQTVTVTAAIALEELKGKGYKLYTSKTGEEDSFEEQASQTFEGNGIMYIKLYDGTNYGGVKTFNVDKIDKLPPNEFTIQKTETTSAAIGRELKDAADDIKQEYQFIRCVSSNYDGISYCYVYDCTIGDIIYCTGENPTGANQVPVGYYKALKNTKNHVDSAGLTNTEYFEYLGPHYMVSDVNYFKYLSSSYITNAGLELKDAADDIKQEYQFIRCVSSNYDGISYCYAYDCTIGDIIYCTGENPTGGNQVPMGYYKALKNTKNHVDTAGLTNTEYFEYLGATYIVNAGIELKNAADDIKQEYQFIRCVSSNYDGISYCYAYDCTIGDIIYCTGENPTGGNQVPVGYYKALKNTKNHVDAAGLTNTEYFEYLGATYTVYVSAIIITPTKEVTDELDSNKKCSGISQYYFSKDGGKSWVTNTEDKAKTSYTFKDLKYGEECTFIMKAIDKAGNERLSDEKKVIIR